MATMRECINMVQYACTAAKRRENNPWSPPPRNLLPFRPSVREPSRTCTVRQVRMRVVVLSWSSCFRFCRVYLSSPFPLTKDYGIVGQELICGQGIDYLKRHYRCLPYCFRCQFPRNILLSKYKTNIANDGVNKNKQRVSVEKTHQG